MMIPFTQYMRPTGRQVDTVFDSSELGDDISDKAKALLEAGCKFESEVLSTGEVHMDCQDIDGELLANVLADNGPVVVEKVGKLVEEAWQILNGEHGL